MKCGNIRLEMDGRMIIHTRVGSIEVDRYGDEAIALKVTSGGEKAKAVIRLSAQECKALVTELIKGVNYGKGGS